MYGASRTRTDTSAMARQPHLPHTKTHIYMISTTPVHCVAWEEHCSMQALFHLHSEFALEVLSKKSSSSRAKRSRKTHQHRTTD